MSDIRLDAALAIAKIWSFLAISFLTWVIITNPDNFEFRLRAIPIAISGLVIVLALFLVANPLEEAGE